MTHVKLFIPGPSEVRDDILLYTHPNQKKFTDEAGVRAEIEALVASGHTAMKFDPFPHLGDPSRRHDGYLDGEMSREGAHTAAELTALIRDRWARRTDRGAEQRLAVPERGVLYQVETLRADPRREMHTRGG